MSEKNDLRRLLNATAGLEAVYRINAILGPSDDAPIARYVAGAWPTMGELRELVELADALRKTYRIRRK
jgi:hypothetical protein